MEVTSGWSLGRASWERCGASNNQRWCNEQIQWLTPFAWYFFFFCVFCFFADIKLCQVDTFRRQEVLLEMKWERCKASNNPCWCNNNWHFLGLLFCILTFFADIYIPWWKKRMIRRKLRTHLDSAASRGPPWKASLQGKSLTVILAPTLSGISGYHLHLILFLLSWENIT